MDAKAIRSTVSDYDSAYQDFVCLVSAFACQSGTVLAQQSYHNKETSEITAARTLLADLTRGDGGLKGATFTLDALHCKKTVEAIIESGNDYLIKVKGNQPKLLRAMKEAITDQAPLDTNLQTERSRGRRERRYVAVYEPSKAVDPAWKKLRRMVYVVRSGWRREGGPYRRESYYITSRLDTAAGFGRGIRGHWSIENRLHWVKDAQMTEDTSGIKSKRAAANLSLLKSLALTRYRHAGYGSLKTATACFANKVKELLLLLRT